MVETIRRFVYVSQCGLSPTEVASLVRDIGADAETTSGINAVTGVLITSKGYLCQLIEGPPDRVATLVASLQNNPDVGELVVLDDSTQEFRRTKGWCFAYDGAPIFLGSFLARLHTEGRSHLASKQALRLLLSFAEKHGSDT